MTNRIKKVIYLHETKIYFKDFFMSIAWNIADIISDYIELGNENDFTFKEMFEYFENKDIVDIDYDMTWFDIFIYNIKNRTSLVLSQDDERKDITTQTLMEILTFIREIERYNNNY